MRIRFTAAAFAAIGCVVPVRVAEAEDVQVESGRCLDEGRLDSALARVWPQSSRPEDTVVRVVEHEANAELEVTAGGVLLGRRSLETEGLPCEEVTLAVALAIAVGVDAPTAPSSPPSSPQAIAVLPRATRRATDPSRDAAQPEPSSARGSVRLASSVDLGVGIGMQPATSAVGSVVLDVALGPAGGSGVEPELSIRGGMIVGFPAASESGGVATSVVAGRLDVCGAALGEAIRARGCLGGIAGAIFTDGSLEEPRIAVGGRIDGRWMPTQLFGLQAGVDLFANLTPDYVARNSRGDLDELGPGLFVVSAGPAVEFF